jgi:hypothetical protein
VGGVVLAALVALGAGTPRGSVRAEEEETTLRETIRKAHPALDQGAITQRGWDARKHDAQQLAEDQFWLQQAYDVLMKKWRAVQEARTAHRKVTQAVAYATGYYTISLLSLESERKDRIQRLVDRENQEFKASLGSKERSEADIAVERADWDRSERAQAYDAERHAVEAWFKGELDAEIQRARTGQSPLMDVLDEMTTEAQDEMAVLSQARKTVEREIEKRAKGIQEERPEVPFEVPEAQRHALHFTPVRTEYEGVAGAPIETIFQVWRGRRPYLLYSRAKGSTELRLRYHRVKEAGQVSVLFSFEKPGTYTAIVNATDLDGSDVKASVTIVVKPDPKRGETPDGEKGSGGGPTGPPNPPAPEGTPPVPVVGTFHALLFGGDAGLPRPDEMPAGVKVTPVPLQVTIDAAGRVKGRADYTHPANAFGKPTKDGARNLVWKVAFELEGQIDWTTGRTHLEVKAGRAETGLEVDTPGFGLYRQSSKAEYTATLDGWSIPSPAADRWLALRSADTAAGASLEGTGRPDVTVRPDGKRLFAAGGFFGDVRGAGVPGVATPWARRVTKAVVRTGYVGKDESDEEQTRMAQMATDMAARMGVTGWYLKLLGAPPAVEPQPAKEEPTPAGALWAFGLWPTRPVQARVGERVQARAMAVFEGDPFEAVDLTSKATWTASPGATVNEKGEVTAAAPGVYRVTASFTGPDGTPMTSTLMVAVAKE